MRPHRRQFVIGPAPFRPYDDWRCQQLDAACWLSHCPTLRIAQYTDADGGSWVLLGLAVATLAAEPQVQIPQTPTVKVPTLYGSWAGRWILLGAGQVHLDASGLLGCCYGRDTSQQLWASSSPALLAGILFPQAAPTVDRRVLRYEVGISWYAPPRSRLAGIRRLLPSQVLDLGRGTVVPRPLMPEIVPDRDPAAAVAEIEQSLLSAISHLARISDRPWLGLTAGYDSRLMLALSYRAGIVVAPFTRISARTAAADRLLPPKLARQCGYPHVAMRRRQFFPERRQLALDHNASCVSAGDAEPFIQGIRDGMTGIAFGGHGFAVASGFAQLRRLPATVDDAERGAAQIARLFQEPLTSSATAGLKEWLTWVLEHPQAHLDWRDRFFIEQRQAGWLAAKEQLYDLLPLERVPILNAARNYAILLGVPPEQRLGSVVQAEMIRRTAPFLLQYPFNPTDRELGLLQTIEGTSWDAPRYLLRKAIQKIRRYAL